MSRRNLAMVGLFVAACMPIASGCGSLVQIFQPSTVSIRLANSSPDFVVKGELQYYDSETVDSLLLSQLGTEVEFTLDPGEVMVLVRDCSDVQAIRISKADLQVVGSFLSPGTSTSIKRDGDEYGCGDVLEFEFTHSNLLIDFDVTFTAR